jgi:purine-binding chemotaxis protein CheW
MTKPARGKKTDAPVQPDSSTGKPRAAQPEAVTIRAQPENRFTKGSLQVVEFLLGKERYAVDLYDIREVVEYTTITKLPNAPSYMKGIIDLRGEITTIVDLKDRLHIPAGSEMNEENSRIIVLDEKITRAKTGIMVDEVLSVSTFDTKDIDSASAADIDDDGAILGIIKKKVKDKELERNDLIIWIDIRHLVNHINDAIPLA